MHEIQAPIVRWGDAGDRAALLGLEGALTKRGLVQIPHTSVLHVMLLILAQPAVWPIGRFTALDIRETGIRVALFTNPPAILDVRKFRTFGFKPGPGLKAYPAKTTLDNSAGAGTARPTARPRSRSGDLWLSDRSRLRPGSGPTQMSPILLREPHSFILEAKSGNGEGLT